MKFETSLIKIAQNDSDDIRANRAMKILRERYDRTYGWCMDCDGLVCKERDCCLNR